MEIITHHFETIDSTNGWALAHLMQFDQKKLTLVTADEQTAARGQYGRRWYAPKVVNLYASFVFFISENEIEPFIWTHLLALAVLDILGKMGVSGEIKQPNDLFVNGKKLAGILCETSPFDKGHGVVIGLGLNVNMSKEECLKIDQPATSLFCETGKKWDIEVILKAITKVFMEKMV